jgi:hypothetical protein
MSLISGDAIKAFSHCVKLGNQTGSFINLKNCNRGTAYVMKEIAENKYAGLSKIDLLAVVSAFTIVISTLGVSTILALDDYWKAAAANSASYRVLFSASVISIIWALCIVIFGLVFEQVLLWRMSLGWPRYFLYTFQFENGAHIVGWSRIGLDKSSRILYAEGSSYVASNDLDENKRVDWKSQAVTSGLYKSRDSCYILYDLNKTQAVQQNRPYRQGLLVFHQLRESDLTNIQKFPAAVIQGEDQYIGQQQGIDKDGIWNFAYAEPIHPKGSTDRAIESFLTQAVRTYWFALVRTHTELESNVQ